MIFTSLVAELMDALRKKSASTKIVLMIRC